MIAAGSAVVVTNYLHRPLFPRLAEALAPGAEIEMIRAGGASDELWVRSPAGTAVRFYTYYFPGWQVSVDGDSIV